MKKILLCLFVLIAAISFHTTTALASGSVDLSRFNIYSTINEDGSVYMKEFITFDFDGDYNGAYRDISTRNTGGVYNVKVSLVSQNGTEVPFKNVQSAKKGDNGVFELIKQDDDLYRIKIYVPSRDQKRNFKITYTMKNVATRYKDTGEFFYDYWSSGNKTKIDNLKIHIAIPKITNSENIKAYFHGMSGGKTSVKKGEVEYSIPHVDSDELVETRVVFPKNAILKSVKSKDQYKLKDILNEELNYKKKIEKKAERRVNITKLFNVGGIVLGLIFSMITVVTRKKFKKRPNYKYSTYVPLDVPEECTPAVAAYLVNGSVNGRTLYASILDLWRRGYLNVQKTEYEDDFVIVRGNKNYEGLLNHEVYIMNWFFNTVGNGKFVNLKTITKSSKNGNFSEKFYKWVRKVTDEARKRNYYDRKASSLCIKISIASLIVVVLSIIAIVLGAKFGIFSMAASIVSLIYGLSYCSRKTEHGQIQYEKWIKFKDYIRNKHFDYNCDTEYMEKYIPYAEALNMESTSMEKLKSAFQDTSSDIGWIYYYVMFDSMSLGGHHRFSYYMYNAFDSGTSGSGNPGSGSYSGGSSGSSGGGGAGGF